MVTLAYWLDLGERMFEGIAFVDLTHRVTTEMPTWSGACGFCHEVKRDYDQGIRILKYTMHASAGTHMDAPSHFYKEGKNIAEIPLEQLIVPCCVIDVSAKRGEALLIHASDVKDYEREHGKIPKGSFVIGFTGWQEFWSSPEKYRNVKEDKKMHFPGFSKESAELLLEREVVGIGIDTLSPDVCNPDNPVHHLMLGEGKYIVENLCQLDQLPKKGGYVFVLPIKIGIGTEACVRCIGAVKKEAK